MYLRPYSSEMRTSHNNTLQYTFSYHCLDTEIIYVARLVSQKYDTRQITMPSEGQLVVSTLESRPQWRVRINSNKLT